MLYTKPMARTVRFSGFEWELKKTGGRALGPGPNWFSDEEDSVWTDKAGLHLKIAFRDGYWSCAEAMLDRPLGHGLYEFSVARPLHDLEQNTVFSGFLYESDEREIDIEFSKFSNPHCRYALGHYVVQPGRTRGNHETFPIPHTERTNHGILWLSDGVTFACWNADDRNDASSWRTWRYEGSDNPPPARPRFIFNLWLNEGRYPDREEEVVVSSFAFTPASEL